MKNFVTFSLLLVIVGLHGCKKNNDQQIIENNESTSEIVLQNQCYLATYEKDTVHLKMNTLKNGDVTGAMQMKIIGEPTKSGTIAGTFHGDTLFVNYTFILGANEKRTFKNPIAFLKKDDQLILGNGTIETNMGASYLSKTKPIDFEQVRYKLSAVTCDVE